MTTGCCCLMGPCPWRQSWQWAHLCEHLGGKHPNVPSLARVGVWSLQHTQCTESAAVLCSLLSLEQGSSRNGFWWEKSQKSFSGSWDEREKGSKCLTQIKQPKKNKGRKKRKAMTSIFFLVNFFHFLCRERVKIGTFGREWLWGERSLCLCTVWPCLGTCLAPSQCWWLLGSARACVIQRGQGCLGMGLTWGRDKHQPESPFPVLPQPPGAVSSMVWPLSLVTRRRLGGTEVSVSEQR